MLARSYKKQRVAELFLPKIASCSDKSVLIKTKHVLNLFCNRLGALFILACYKHFCFVGLR